MQRHDVDFSALNTSDFEAIVAYFREIMTILTDYDPEDVHVVARTAFENLFGGLANLRGERQELARLALQVVAQEIHIIITIGKSIGHHRSYSRVHGGRNAISVRTALAGATLCSFYAVLAEMELVETENEFLSFLVYAQRHDVEFSALDTSDFYATVAYMRQMYLVDQNKLEDLEGGQVSLDAVFATVLDLTGDQRELAHTTLRRMAEEIHTFLSASRKEEPLATALRLSAYLAEEIAYVIEISELTDAEDLAELKRDMGACQEDPKESEAPRVVEYEVVG
ncbi:hypothetical protein DXG01_009349 [Tephrocybe rancida]|nr:hypothetical protein DXG01_009349 [Tephrocybe rancida]